MENLKCRRHLGIVAGIGPTAVLVFPWDMAHISAYKRSTALTRWHIKPFSSIGLIIAAMNSDYLVPASDSFGDRASDDTFERFEFFEVSPLWLSITC